MFMGRRLKSPSLSNIPIIALLMSKKEKQTPKREPQTPKREPSSPNTCADQKEKQSRKREPQSRKREPSSPTTCADYEEFAQTPYHSLLLRKAEALDLLNGTKVPAVFKFRERESKRIESFLQSCMLDQKKGMRFLMLTGAPGAGKTLTANTILSKYDCRVISMNANIVKTLQDVQRVIGSELLGKGGSSAMTTHKLMNKLIEKKFNDVCVVFIEEVEVIFNKNPTQVAQNFLQLFKRKEMRLVLVGISNTIDTLIKCGNKLGLRKQEVENIIFEPYGGKQIMDMMRDKLVQIEEITGLKVSFNEKFMKYAANKLQIEKKGDFRVCLQFLKGVVQLVLEAQASSKMQFEVSIQKVNQILAKINIIKHSNIQNLPYPQQIMLVALYNVFLKKDALCITPAQLKEQVRFICRSMSLDFSDFKMNDSLSELQQHSLVQLRQEKNKKKDERKVMLKVALEQIKYALNGNLSFKEFFPDS